MAEKKEEYDFAIIGAGVAGLAAAMYGARLGLKTICFGATTGSENAIGGVITTTKIMENYPGFQSISGEELAEKLLKHAEAYNLVTIKKERVENIEKKEDKFHILTKKAEYGAKAVLLATGAKWRKLEVPGGKEFENRGVAYCAICDSPLYKNKVVAVIGGADSAVRDAIILTEYAKEVYIIYRKDKLRAEKANVEKLEKNKKVKIIYNTNVIEVKGDKAVKSILLDREYNGKKEIEVEGVFVAIGHVPNTELAKKIGIEMNESGEIKINHKTSETSLSGVFAAGDITDKKFKQAISGVAEGCIAAYSAYDYLQKNAK